MRVNFHFTSILTNRLVIVAGFAILLIAISFSPQALMTEALKAVDRDGLIANLESSNPKNVSLYERHGVEIISEIQSGNSPVVRPMLRRAR
jgi:hypothetical protein